MQLAAAQVRLVEALAELERVQAHARHLEQAYGKAATSSRKPVAGSSRSACASTSNMTSVQNRRAQRKPWRWPDEGDRELVQTLAMAATALAIGSGGGERT